MALFPSLGTEALEADAATLALEAHTPLPPTTCVHGRLRAGASDGVVVLVTSEGVAGVGASEGVREEWGCASGASRAGAWEKAGGVLLDWTFKLPFANRV